MIKSKNGEQRWVSSKFYLLKLVKIHCFSSCLETREFKLKRLHLYFAQRVEKNKIMIVYVKALCLESEYAWHHLSIYPIGVGMGGELDVDMRTLDMHLNQRVGVLIT